MKTDIDHRTMSREQLIEAGYISARRHPTEPLTILNYTKNAQFEGVWNQHTCECRGLIIHDDGTVVARPYPKFFNVGQEGAEIPESFRVLDKADGSLGIIYREPVSGLVSVATRGSFASEQAIWATEHLRSTYPDFCAKFPQGVTFLVEIIYPENRIVIDYAGFQGLMLHGVVHNATGADAYDEVEALWWGPRVQSFSVEQFRDQTPRPNAEGYVLVEHPAPTDRPARRVKVKFEEYMRLHKLLSGLTPHRVWECVSTGTDLVHAFEGVPDEMFHEAAAKEQEYLREFASIERDVRTVLKHVPAGDRKAQAAYLAELLPSKTRAIAFLMLDGKAYAKKIWALLEPRGDEKFSSTKNVEAES